MRNFRLVSPISPTVTMRSAPLSTTPTPSPSRSTPSRPLTISDPAARRLVERALVLHAISPSAADEMRAVIDRCIARLDRRRRKADS